MASQHPSSSAPCDPDRKETADPLDKQELEIIYDEGSDEKLLSKECKKNPGHPTFIPVKEFKMADIPLPEYQTEKMMKIIKYHSDLTVRITFGYISLKRPNTYPNSTAPYPAHRCKGKTGRWVGTGSFFRCNEPREVKKACPCPECKQSGKPKTEYYKMFVRTALHNIFDMSEAGSAVVELFYDSEDKKGIKRLYGVEELNKDHIMNCGDEKKIETKHYSDYFYLRCVTHDRELFEVVKGLFSDPELFGPYTQTESSLSFIISHPHGLSKHITFGKVVHFSYPIHHTRKPSAYTMFTIDKETECRLTEYENANENSSASSIESESFESLVNSDIPCTPGVIHILHNSINLSLPNGSTYFCESDLTENDTDNRQQSVRWVRFPAGTRLVNGDGSGTTTDSNFLPAMMEFKVEMTNYFDSGFFRYSYDIDTCRGSSGAAVYLMGYTNESQGWIFHAGRTNSRMNRSGDYPLYFKEHKRTKMFRQTHNKRNPKKLC